jgi:tetratricopeptide (TPR) repeat protein
LPAVLPLVRRLCAPLAYLHGEGLVHRDLKPENILVTVTGTPKLSDFGIAKLRSAKYSRLTATGIALGTPEYMSPEQAAGRSGRVDARTDVYALGATLYALLAGRPPHRHDDLAALLKMVESEEPAPPRRLNPSVPRELETILLKALEKEPDRRYATAAELADDLGRFLEGEPVRARRAGLFYRLRKRLVKRRAVVAAALAGVLAVSAILAPRWWAERQGREREERLRRADVAALQELGALWGAVVVEKQGLHNPGNDPAEVLARIRAAVERVGDFVRRHPERPQGWYVRARGRLYLGDLRGAEEDLRRALREAPDFAPGWALLGRAKLEQHTSRAYRKDWREASPLLEEARDCLGRARKAGAEKSSVSSWGLAPTQEDEVAETLTDALAEVYLGEAPEGRRRLEEANRRQEQAEYCNWLGVLSGASGDDAAEAAWQTRALAKMAHFAKAYLDRGNARLETDPEGAADDFTRALRIDPRRTPALRGRGVARGLAGDFDGAVADYTALAGRRVGVRAAGPRPL